MAISGDYWTKNVGVALKEVSSRCLASAGDEQLEATLAVSTGGARSISPPRGAGKITSAHS